MRYNLPISTTAPTGAETITLYSDPGNGNNSLARNGVETLWFRTWNSHAFTLRVYAGINQEGLSNVFQDYTFSAGGSGTPRWVAIDLRGMQLVKVDVINGADAQTTWYPELQADSEPASC